MMVNGKMNLNLPGSSFLVIYDQQAVLLKVPMHSSVQFGVSY